MKRVGKIILISIFLITSVVILFLANFLNKRTIKSKGDIPGNTAGNLYNGGIFCEKDGYIYFSNFNDDGALYRMDTSCTNVVKIHNDKIAYINVDDHYIYYSRINNERENNSSANVFNFYNRGIYRIDKDGSKARMLYKDPSGLVSLYNNTIFYQHYTTKDATSFYQVNIDGSGEKRIMDDPILPASIYNGKMYYAGVNNDHNIHALDLSNLTDQVVVDRNCYLPIANDDGIYYISLDDRYALCRVNKKGQDKTILVDEFCSSFNLSNDGRYLYYQVDGGDNNRICELDLRTNQTKTIQDGDFKQINVTSNFVFFRSFNGNRTFAYDIQTKTLSTFHPPILKIK